jgi:S-adenosylhomocysteine hydrolase
VWRAAQVVVADDALVQQFERANAEQRSAPSSKGVASPTKGGEETFADAYDRSKREKRYTLSPAAHVVNALAAVAGDDGVLQGDEWKKLGPKVGALALLVAEKSRTAAPLTGDKTAVLLADLNETAKKALRSTTENIVGVDRMPVLARLAEQAEKTKPLSNHRLFAVQHLFASTYGLFQALQQAGVKAEGSVVFGKSYSTNSEVKDALQASGFQIYDDYGQKQAVVDDKGMIVGLEAPLLTELRRALQAAASAKPPQKLLLLDEGGKLNKMIHDVFPQHAHLCTVVEQTTNGLQNMAGTTLLAPAVSVASSQLKREVEGPIIGEDVTAATLDILDGIDPRLAAGKTVGIVGYGAIGIATAEAFARRGFQVVVTDVRPEALARLAERQTSWPNGGSIQVKPRAEVLGAGIIVGCTGTGAMTLDEMKLVKDGAVLVSAASGDHEFPVVHTKAGQQQGATADHTPMKDWQKLFDTAAADLAQKKRTPIVSTSTVTTSNGANAGITSAPLVGEFRALRARFPAGNGDVVDVPWDGSRHGNYVMQQDRRTFMVLRGGTPVNLGRDLPPEAIQLTRSMLFAACVQAVGEKTPGWKTFSPTTQQAIEDHWRSLRS